MHHKRRRPKTQRAGCTCKWWKHTTKGGDRTRPMRDQRRMQEVE